MLTLYDFETSTPDKWFSPPVVKVRLALNYKNIPHKTVWLTYATLQESAKQLGFPVDDTLPLNAEGNPVYSVPTLHDPSTNTWVNDSTRIIEYLDKVYPDTPRLFYPGTKPLLALLDAEFSAALTHPLIMVRGLLLLDKPSQDKLRSRADSATQSRLKEVLASEKLQAELWETVKAGLDKLDVHFKKAEKHSYFTAAERADGNNLGETTVTLADFIIGSRLLWCRKALGEHDEAWNAIVSWNDGRWGDVVERIAPYFKIY